MRRVDLREPNSLGLKEGRQTYKPEVIVLPSAAEVDKYAASRVLDQLRKKPTSVFTLPTGNTPIGMYENLVRERADFSRATIFNIDEYWPIRPDSTDSYASYMRRNLLDHVQVGAWYIPNGGAPDPHIEAERYGQLLAEHRPVDMVVAGLGPGTTCHIGFNERGSAVDSPTRYVTMDEQTKEVNAKIMDNPDDLPDGAITQGIRDMLEAEEFVLIAKGVGKAWGINRILKGEISSDAPGSFIRLHPKVTIILDEEAAQYL